MKKILIYISIFISMSFSLAGILAVASYWRYSNNKFERDLWSKVQGWRKQNDLQTYTQDPRLCTFADKRLRQISLDWSHNNFENNTWIFDNTDYNEAGENLYRGLPFPDSTLRGWLESPTHKENLESDLYTHGCIRCNYFFCVHIFGGYREQEQAKEDTIKLLKQQTSIPDNTVRASSNNNTEQKESKSTSFEDYVRKNDLVQVDLPDMSPDPWCEKEIAPELIDKVGEYDSLVKLHDSRTEDYDKYCSDDPLACGSDVLYELTEVERRISRLGNEITSLANGFCYLPN